MNEREIELRGFELLERAIALTKNREVGCFCVHDVRS